MDTCSNFVKFHHKIYSNLGPCNPSFCRHQNLQMYFQRVEFFQGRLWTSICSFSRSWVLDLKAGCWKQKCFEEIHFGIIFEAKSRWSDLYPDVVLLTSSNFLSLEEVDQKIGYHIEIKLLSCSNYPVKLEYYHLINYCPVEG